MELLHELIGWAGDSVNSNAVRTVAALLAIPGALWGFYLFIRWIRGVGLDARVDAIHAQNKILHEQYSQLHEDFRLWMTRLTSMPDGSNTQTKLGASDALPSKEEIEWHIAAALQRLPERLRKFLRSVKISVQDFPSEELKRSLAISSKFDLLGHFEGPGLRSSSGAGCGNTIWLFRRPILAFYAEHEESLNAIVTYVLAYHVGRLLGLSENELQQAQQT